MTSSAVGERGRRTGDPHLPHPVGTFLSEDRNRERTWVVLRTSSRLVPGALSQKGLDRGAVSTEGSPGCSRSEGSGVTLPRPVPGLDGGGGRSRWSWGYPGGLWCVYAHACVCLCVCDLSSTRLCVNRAQGGKGTGRGVGVGQGGGTGEEWGVLPGCPPRGEWGRGGRPPRPRRGWRKWSPTPGKGTSGTHVDNDNPKGDSR